MIVNWINECWTYDCLRLDREVILHLGNVVSVLTLKLAVERFFFFCCLCCGKSSQGLQIPILSVACSGFAMPLFLVVQREACPLYCWSTRVIKLQDPASIIMCCLFTSPLQRNKIQAQKDNITMDYILPVLYILQHPKLSFLASGLCR